MSLLAQRMRTISTYRGLEVIGFCGTAHFRTSENCIGLILMSHSAYQPAQHLVVVPVSVAYTLEQHRTKDNPNCREV
jgi:hypothetical protein